jgi:hypothetical protein
MGAMRTSEGENSIALHCKFFMPCVAKLWWICLLLNMLENVFVEVHWEVGAKLHAFFYRYTTWM